MQVGEQAALAVMASLQDVGMGCQAREGCIADVWVSDFFMVILQVKELLLAAIQIKAKLSQM